jgi:hypothetical protein
LALSPTISTSSVRNTSPSPAAWSAFRNTPRALLSQAEPGTTRTGLLRIAAMMTGDGSREWSP